MLELFMKNFLLDLLFFIDANIIEFIKIPQEGRANLNKKVFEELYSITKDAEKYKISITILGSCALTILLGRDFKRIEDIDLAVHNSSLMNFKKLLIKHGYKESLCKWPNGFCFIKDKTKVDFFDIDNEKHIYFNIPFKTKRVCFEGNIYPILLPSILYRTYVAAFLRKRRNTKDDLIKLKILRMV